MDKLLKVYTLFFLSWVDGGCCLSFFSFLFFASPKKRNKRKATFIHYVDVFLMVFMSRFAGCRIAPREKRLYAGCAKYLSPAWR